MNHGLKWSLAGPVFLVLLATMLPAGPSVWAEPDVAEPDVMYPKPPLEGRSKFQPKVEAKTEDAEFTVYSSERLWSDSQPGPDGFKVERQTIERAAWYSGSGQEPMIDIEAHASFLPNFGETDTIRHGWGRQVLRAEAAVEVGEKGYASTGWPYVVIHKFSGLPPEPGKEIHLSMQCIVDCGIRDLNKDGAHDGGFQAGPDGFDSWRNGRVKLRYKSGTQDVTVFDVYAWRDYRALNVFTQSGWGYESRTVPTTGGWVRYGDQEYSYWGGDFILVNQAVTNVSTFDLFIGASVVAQAFYPDTPYTVDERQDFRTSYAHTFVDPYIRIDPDTPEAEEYEVRIMDRDGRFVPTRPADLTPTEDPAPQPLDIVLPGARASRSGYAIYRENDTGETGATITYAVDVTGDVPIGAALELWRPGEATPFETYALDPAAPQVEVGPTFWPSGTREQIQLVVRDERGAQAVTQLSLTVEDITPPDILGCGVESRSFELDTHPGVRWITVDMLGITATDDGGWVSVTLGSPDPRGIPMWWPGGGLPVIVEDAAGNLTPCNVPVTITDTTPPIIWRGMPDRTIFLWGAAPTTGPTPLAYGAQDLNAIRAMTLELFDADGEAVPIRPPPPGAPPEYPSTTSYEDSGTVGGDWLVSLPLGSHTFTCVATDPAGNSAEWVTKIDVVPGHAPYFTCDDIFAGNEPGECFAFVPFAVTTLSAWTALNDTRIVYTAAGGEVVSGDMFLAGITPVTAQGQQLDASGAWVDVYGATCTFWIQVRDLEAPVINGPSTVTLQASTGSETRWLDHETLGVSAHDNCDLIQVPSIHPAQIGLGTTLVTIRASDVSGNSASHVMEVIVANQSLDCRLLKPLEATKDNRIKSGRTVPVKVLVHEANVPVTDAVLTLLRVERLDSDGEAAGEESVDDSGKSNNDTNIFRLSDEDEFYIFNLSTKGWTSKKKTRFKVTVKIEKEGYGDSFCEFFLINK